MCEFRLGEEEDFHIDGWIMHNVIYFLTDGMFTLTRDGTQRYIFDVFDVRLHYTMQLPICCRFCCRTSMKKM
jgi:hypothetical protein